MDFLAGNRRALLIAALCGMPFQSGRADRFIRATESQKEGRLAQALHEFLIYVEERPQSDRVQEALRKIWEIAQGIKKKDEELRLDPAVWRETVKQARETLVRRRKEARELVNGLSDVARSLPKSAAPLEVLRRSPVSPVSLNSSSLDEFSRLQAEQFLSSIQRAVDEILNSPSLSEGDLHEAKGYYWLYKGDLDLAQREWGRAVKLKPDDDALKVRWRAVRAQWREGRRRDEAERAFSLGLSDFKLGEYARAQSRFEKALRINPHNSEAKRHADLCRRALEEASRQKRIQALMIQANAFYDAGSLLDAVQSWVDILTLEPTNAEARRYLERSRNRLISKPVDPPKPPVGSKDKTPPPPAPLDPEVAHRKAEEAYSLGIIHYSDGDLQAALESFSLSLEYEPGLEKARQAFKQVSAELGLKK